MSVLESISYIGKCMVRASVEESIGDIEGAEEIRYSACLDVEGNGYHHGASGDEYSEPSYLDYYPGLKAYWYSGYQSGVVHREISSCSCCQDPDTVACPFHG